MFRSCRKVNPEWGPDCSAVSRFKGLGSGPDVSDESNETAPEMSVASVDACFKRVKPKCPAENESQVESERMG